MQRNAEGEGSMKTIITIVAFCLIAWLIFDDGARPNG